MFKGKLKTSAHGFSIVEVIIATSILSMVGITILLSVRLYTTLSVKSSQNIKTANVIAEKSEMVRFIATDNWEQNIDPLILDEQYEIVVIGGEIIIRPFVFEAYTGGADATQNEPRFYSYFTLSELMRDSENQVVAGSTEAGSGSGSGSASVDPNSLFVNLVVGFPYRNEVNETTSQIIIHKN